jgi:hypothetical protein
VKIFIGGALRTGTTLIHGILCKDEKTFKMQKECTYLRFLLQAYTEGKKLWNVHTDDYFDNPEHFMFANKQILSNYFHHIYNRFGKDKIMVQKHPGLIDYFPELEELFPNDCLFIVVLRDPRDAISSFLDFKRFDGYDIQRVTDQYIGSYYYFMNYYEQKRWMPNVLFVKYEELLTNTNQVMIDLREFTGLELKNDLTKDTWESKRGIGGDELVSELYGKPIDSNNIGKYKENLSIHEIEYINERKDEINDILKQDVFYN